MRVELEDVGKTYDGEQWAIRHLALDIPSGSIFGLIGPNGAGKSTTLRMMATVMVPTEGRVRLGGLEVGADPLAARRQIGFLGDGNPLYKDATPAEYLRLFGQCFKLPRAELERAIDETLATFDLTSKRDAPCGQLSKGMRQRVLIARCLLHRPSLLILDEPADGLDPRGRNDLRRSLQRIREQGVTIVISSHILRELDELCDQVAIVQQGKLVVAGPVERIIDTHEVSRFVFELRVLDGYQRALELLGQQRVLIEHVDHVDHVDHGEPASAGEPASIRLQVQGGEGLMADVLALLIREGVRVVTCSRIRSRLEDVYDRVSEDQVN